MNNYDGLWLKSLTKTLIDCDTPLQAAEAELADFFHQRAALHLKMRCQTGQAETVPGGPVHQFAGESNFIRMKGGAASPANGCFCHERGTMRPR